MDFPEGIDTILSGTLHQRRTEPILIQDWTVFFPCEQIHSKNKASKQTVKTYLLRTMTMMMTMITRTTKPPTTPPIMALTGGPSGGQNYLDVHVFSYSELRRALYYLEDRTISMYMYFRIRSFAGHFII